MILFQIFLSCICTNKKTFLKSIILHVFLAMRYHRLIKSATKEVGKSKQDTQNFCKYSLCLFWLNSPQRVANPRANFKLGWGFSLMVNVFTLASFLCSC